MIEDNLVFRHLHNQIFIRETKKIINEVLPGKSHIFKFEKSGCSYGVGSFVVSITPTFAAPSSSASKPRRQLINVDLPTPLEEKKMFNRLNQYLFIF